MAPTDGLNYTELHNVVDGVLKQFPGAKVVRLYGRPQDGAHHVFEIRFKGCTITVDEFGRVAQKPKEHVTRVPCG